MTPRWGAAALAVALATLSARAAHLGTTNYPAGAPPACRAQTHFAVGCACAAAGPGAGRVTVSPPDDAAEVMWRRAGTGRLLAAEDVFPATAAVTTPRPPVVTDCRPEATPEPAPCPVALPAGTAFATERAAGPLGCASACAAAGCPAAGCPAGCPIATAATPGCAPNCENLCGPVACGYGCGWWLRNRLAHLHSPGRSHPVRDFFHRLCSDRLACPSCPPDPYPPPAR